MLKSKEFIENVKKIFLEENNLDELDLTVDNTSIGNIEDIDLENEEVWLLQCPKGINVEQLETQKLKFPGRTNLPKLEVLTVQFPETKQSAFGYCSRKGRYGVRLLPFRGSMVLREPLKGNAVITSEQYEEACNHVDRAVLPEFIKLRHPLFGASFKKNIKLANETEKRLRLADKNSKDVTHASRHLKSVKKSIKQEITTPEKEVSKKRKIKTEETLHKKIKIKEEISEDLQWLQNM